jgi:hypothetical protein
MFVFTIADGLPFVLVNGRQLGVFEEAHRFRRQNQIFRNTTPVESRFDLQRLRSDDFHS